MTVEAGEEKVPGFVVPCSLCEGKESPDENCPECGGEGAVLDSESLLVELKGEVEETLTALSFIVSQVERIESLEKETGESLRSLEDKLESSLLKVKQNSVALLVALFHIAKGDGGKAESFLRAVLVKNGVDV